MSRRSDIRDEQDVERREKKRQADGDKAFADEAERLRYHHVSDPVVRTDRWWVRLLNFLKRI